MFGFSILYLFLLFAVLLADRLWGLAAQAVSHFAA
jgi:heme O synthase-like polyprenyltransferase